MPRKAKKRAKSLGDLLDEHGFEHYEISNWARPGHTCRHNLLYWTNANWWPVGPSASGHADGHHLVSLRLDVDDTHFATHLSFDKPLYRPGETVLPEGEPETLVASP